MQRPVVSGAIFAVAAALGAAHLARFRGFLSDDALISLRYAKRLNQGLGLTWTDGEWVEGYSNLLWVLGAAGLEWVGVDLVVAPRVWGVLAWFAALWAVSVDPADLTRPRWRRVATGGALVVTTAGLAAWAMGGLEHTFQAALAVWVVVTAVRAAEGRGSYWVPAAILGAVVLTRVDGFVLFAGAGLGLLVALGPRGALRAWPVVALPVALMGGQQVFRVLYYGDWVPNTARVKVSLTWARTWVGLRYVGRGFLAHPVLAIGAIAATVVERRAGARTWVPACMAWTWIAYVAWVGGDFFLAWRQLVPAMAVMAWQVAGAMDRARDRRWVALWVVLIPLHAVAANRGEIVDKARLTQWVWDGAHAGARLRNAFGARRAYLAVDAAGSLPFHAELPALDMLGLTDAWLPRHPPPHWGQQGLGHDLGNGSYVWSRKPDIVVFNSALGSAEPRWVSGRQLLARKDFAQTYQQVPFQMQLGSRRVHMTYFLRRADGPLAIQRTEDRIEIPAWFLANPGSPGARFGRKGVFVPVESGTVSAVSRLEVPAGTWLVEVPEWVRVDVRCAGRSASRPRAGSAATVLGTSGEPRVAVELWSVVPDETVRVRQVVLRRVERAPTLVCDDEAWVAPSRIREVVAPDGASATAPGVFQLGAAGVEVRLDKRRPLASLELSVDRAVTHEVRWHRTGEAPRVTRLEAGEGTGLLTHRVDAPGAVRSDGVDVIEVVPVGGARRSALGHVRPR